MISKMEHLEIVFTIAIAFYGISKKQKQQKKNCQKNKENVKSWMHYLFIIWIKVSQNKDIL